MRKHPLAETEEQETIENMEARKNKMFQLLLDRGYQRGVAKQLAYIRNIHDAEKYYTQHYAGYHDLARQDIETRLKSRSLNDADRQQLKDEMRHYEKKPLGYDVLLTGFWRIGTILKYGKSLFNIIQWEKRIETRETEEQIISDLVRDLVAFVKKDILQNPHYIRSNDEVYIQRIVNLVGNAFGIIFGNQRFVSHTSEYNDHRNWLMDQIFDPNLSEENLYRFRYLMWIVEKVFRLNAHLEQFLELNIQSITIIQMIEILTRYLVPPETDGDLDISSSPPMEQPPPLQVNIPYLSYIGYSFDLTLNSSYKILCILFLVVMQLEDPSKNINNEIEISLKTSSELEGDGNRILPLREETKRSLKDYHVDYKDDEYIKALKKFQGYDRSDIKTIKIMRDFLVKTHNDKGIKKLQRIFHPNDQMTNEIVMEQLVSFWINDVFMVDKRNASYIEEIFEKSKKPEPYKKMFMLILHYSQGHFDLMRFIAETANPFVISEEECREEVLSIWQKIAIEDYSEEKTALYIKMMEKLDFEEKARKLIEIIMRMDSVNNTMKNTIQKTISPFDQRPYEDILEMLFPDATTCKDFLLLLKPSDERDKYLRISGHDEIRPKLWKNLRQNVGDLIENEFNDSSSMDLPPPEPARTGWFHWGGSRRRIRHLNNFKSRRQRSKRQRGGSGTTNLGLKMPGRDDTLFVILKHALTISQYADKRRFDSGLNLILNTAFKRLRSFEMIRNQYKNLINLITHAVTIILTRTTFFTPETVQVWLRHQLKNPDLSRTNMFRFRYILMIVVQVFYACRGQLQDLLVKYIGLLEILNYHLMGIRKDLNDPNPDYYKISNSKGESLKLNQAKVYRLLIVLLYIVFRFNKTLYGVEVITSTNVANTIYPYYDRHISSIRSYYIESSADEIEPEMEDEAGLAEPTVSSTRRNFGSRIRDAFTHFGNWFQRTRRRQHD